MTLDEAADKLRQKGISSVLYFHCDHFEPWSRGPSESSIRGVDRFYDLTTKSQYGRKLSLFYSTYNPASLDEQLSDSIGARVPGDAVVFQRHTDRSQEIRQRIQGAIRPLIESAQHEFHLHVHHEWWTNNSYNLDSPISRWVNKQADWARDELRLDLFIRTSIASIESETGQPFEQWAFVHGNWALCASDDQICRVQNEIKTLMANGCWGDFTFPAGRQHCDPALPRPFSCAPASGRRAFESKDADIREIGPGAQALSPDKFFIWNSPIKAPFSSLDYYDEGNRQRFTEPMKFVDAWIDQSIVMGDVLFLKTHSHSMKTEYQLGDSDAPIPHTYPDVVKIFDLFQKICDRANVEFVPASVNEVMHTIATIDGGRPQGDFARTARAAPIKSGMGIQERAEAVGTHLGRWVKSTGQTDDSIGEFYTHQLKSSDNLKLQPYEKAAVEYVQRTFSPTDTRIIEVGPGLGTLSGVLACLGYEVVAVEGHKVRHAGLTELAQFVESQGEGKLSPVLGWFPDFEDKRLLSPERKNLCIMTNIVASAVAQHQEEVLRNLYRFDDVILDTSRFGIARDATETLQLETRLRRRFAIAANVYLESPYHLIHLKTHSAANPSDPSRGRAKREARIQQSLEDAAADVTRARKDIVFGSSVAPDPAYEDRLASEAFVEKFEIEALAKALTAIGTQRSVLVEIGAGQGGLAAAAALAGHHVIGIESALTRYQAAVALMQSLSEDLGGRLQFVEGLFPDDFNPAILPEDVTRIGFASNLINSHTAMRQEQILRAAAAHFDELVIDIARFGVERDTLREKTALISQLSQTFFEPVELIYRVDTLEFWRFRTRKIVGPRV
jgi:protein-L-isoaspartate O-methyltransferase